MLYYLNKPTIFMDILPFDPFYIHCADEKVLDPSFFLFCVVEGNLKLLC